jgi:aminoglycoside phosphotransferase (APT) family kinase protein
VTPEWLSDKLAAKGALQRGQVTGIDCDAQAFNKGYLSNIASLALTYSAEATGSLPARLFLKMSKPGLHAELLSRGQHEVQFYSEVGRAVDLPVPVCYDAEYDEARHLAHILMDDLSATHFQKPLPIPPSNRHCELIMESLAQVHARWWNSPRLGTEIGERLGAEAGAESRLRLENTVPQFFDYLGDALLPQQRQAYEWILASSFLSRRERRLREQSQVTLIHGDAHAGNMLLPHAAQQRVILIDWHLWGIDVAAIDLAFLLALHWSPQRRAILEKPLLERYHQQLLASGVSGYGWDNLWRDYREAVIVMALIPIGQFRRKSPAGVVWFGMQDSLAAFEDLKCRELL